MSTNHESHLWDLRPEALWEIAAQGVKAALENAQKLLAHDGPIVIEAMGADEVEMLAVQLQLQVINLKVAANQLRKVEEQRRMLARRREQEELRFEKEPMDDRDDLTDWNDGGHAEA